MPVILFTSKNEASKNIAMQLIGLGYRASGNGFWEKGGVKLIDTNAETVLDIPTNFDTDYIIVLSSHKSKNEQKALTAHFPGNPGKADFGGEPRTLNVAYAGKLKQIMQNMKKESEAISNEHGAGGTGWEITLEADHHGPTCSVPIIFVEIGSTEKQWNDEIGCKIVAKSVDAAINDQRKFEPVLAIGCGHYPKEFNRIELEDESVAVGHIIPKYHLESLDESVFRQAVEKNVERVRKCLALKNNLNLKQKTMLKDLCEKFSLEYAEI